MTLQQHNHSNRPDAVPHGANEDRETLFRSVSVDGRRRGIRLERVFWSVLKDMAKARQVRLGELVGAIAASDAEASNLTALLRVEATRWLLQQVAGLQKLTDARMINGLVQASPAPAIALREDKRIHSYNPAFASFIQTRLVSLSGQSPIGQLRFALDTQVKDIVNRLILEGNKPQAVGFVLGTGDGRLRGRLSAVLAPYSGDSTIIGYVS